MISVADPYKPVHFLVVDDDEICIMAIKRAMKKLGIANPMSSANNGIEALEILNGALDPDAPLPRYVLLLDLSMPKMGGLELLEKLRADPLLKKLVVFVLTTSDAPKDITAAYEKNIAGYIVKDNLSETISKALSMLDGYSRLVVLPS
ncbi:response regulator [Granulosicoccus antarcticus]|uniref:Response regulatory domain-containing protein n=1 Tax=Granulosicoccus antarcticus IMCC3135 TaxID=1192854 RepID=A0A2Z2NZN3_9GAMM|nr:response regulator [Granulosicoccus antarcticus]ASJ76739.1 hypothetical protein IMCC3135_33475 [Granulosicoccus antarcticus IMCC3135]